MVFCLRPDVFHRIGFRSIRGKFLDEKAFMFCDKFLYDFSFVSRAVVPNQNDGAVDDEKHVVNEFYNLLGADVVGIDTKVRADIISAALKRPGPDRGESVAGSGVPDDRSLTAQPPCRMTDRGHLKPRLILEYQGRAELFDFFLMRGHSSFIQRRISFSSRSAALRCGFCQESPS